MEEKKFSIPQYHKILQVEDTNIRNELEDLQKVKTFSRRLLLCVFFLFVFFVVALCLYSVDVAKDGAQEKFLSILGVTFFTVDLVSLLIALLSIGVKHVQTLSFSLIKGFLMVQLMATTALTILFSGQIVVTIKKFSEDCIDESCEDGQSTVISMTIIDGICVLLSLLSIFFSLVFRDSLWRIIEGQAQQIMRNFRQPPHYGSTPTGTASTWGHSPLFFLICEGCDHKIKSLIEGRK